MAKPASTKFQKIEKLIELGMDKDLAYQLAPKDQGGNDTKAEVLDHLIELLEGDKPEWREQTLEYQRQIIKMEEELNHLKEEHDYYKDKTLKFEELFRIEHLYPWSMYRTETIGKHQYKAFLYWLFMGIPFEELMFFDFEELGIESIEELDPKSDSFKQASRDKLVKWCEKNRRDEAAYAEYEEAYLNLPMEYQKEVASMTHSLEIRGYQDHWVKVGKEKS